MAKLADRAAKALAVAKILDEPTNELYLDAAKWCADRGYGKAEQQVGGSVAVKFEVVVRRESGHQETG